MPRVSVVIPAYNAAAFVCAAIDSVLKQTYPHIEIVVVDDASADDTSAVVQRYVDAGQAVLVRHDKNKGLPGARNTAIRHSTGDFIAFLDADDLWLPNHLTEALAALQAHQTVDVIVQNFDSVDMHTGKKLGNWFAARGAAMSALQVEPIGSGAQLVTGGLLSALLIGSFIHMQSVVARRSVCDTVMFDERLRRSEDLDWAIRLAHSGKHRMAINSLVTGIYHRHDNSLTTQVADNSELIARSEQLMFSEYLQWPDLSEGHRRGMYVRMRRYGLALSYLARLRGDLRGGFAHWWRSLPYGISQAHVVELLKLLASIPIAAKNRGLG